MQSKKKKGEG